MPPAPDESEGDQSITSRETIDQWTLKFDWMRAFLDYKLKMKNLPDERKKPILDYIGFFYQILGQEKFSWKDDHLVSPKLMQKIWKKKWVICQCMC